VPDRSLLDLQVLSLPQVGISEAKNRAVALARGRYVLLVNDDVEPEPDFVREHWLAQQQVEARGGLMVLGAAPFRPVPAPVLFDHLVARTRMIFFYSELARGNCYDFRNAWNLNLSLKRELLIEGGAFSGELRPCMYEDLELAFRLAGQRRAVWYHERARAWHNHRYSLAGYLVREVLLGLMAPVLWRANPDCFTAVFGGDLDAAVAVAERSVPQDVRDLSRVLAGLASSAQRAAPEAPCEELLELWYLAHLPLKRRAFRVGLLAATSSAASEPWTRRPEHAQFLAQQDPVLGAAFEHGRTPPGRAA
jgi:hypothetical protein